MENIYSVLIAVVTVLGSAGAFRYYEKRAINKERDDDFIRHDCKERIAKLEALLVQSSNEKDELRKMIIEMTAQVAELRVKVEFLSADNQKLSGNKKILKG
jgi:septal ring factor EnvC (AmiA/AmiB activator)